MSEFRFVKNIRLDLDDLHFQYMPRVFNRKFWAGDGPLLVKHSPHVRFLRVYEKAGLKWDVLWDTDYVKMMLYWDSIGYHKRDRKFIKRKIIRFTSLHKSIKHSGYDEEHPIQILKTPFWVSRYGETAPFLGKYEIWHGHHRAAACYVRGICKVKCRMLRDRKRGSKRCKRLDAKLSKIKIND